MGLVIGEGIAIFDPDTKSRNDFMLMNMILLTGFALIALAATLFVEKKINNKLLSIKHSLLYLTKDNYFADKYLAKRKIIKEPFAGLADLLLQMREYFVEYEQSINKKYQTLNQREKMRALDHLSTSIAHEINNPLAGILGHAQLAKGKSADLPLQKHLGIIEKEIRKIKDFTRNLMRFSKNIPLACKTININQIILETLSLMETQLKDKGVQVQKKLTSNEDVHVDALQLQQVFVNLINNAIYAMERYQERILTIHTKDTKNGVHIQFSDTGVGVPDNIGDKIFEPFFTTKEPEEGKGLGLSICFGIIKGHKGNIYLESSANRGSTFIIDLPYENLQDQEDITRPILSEKPIDLQQETPFMEKGPTSSKPIPSIVNRPADQIEETKSSMLNKQKLANMENPFQDDKKNDAMSELKEKLKASSEIPKMELPQMDKLDIGVSLHESTSQPLQANQVANKKNDATMIYEQSDKEKPKQKIDIQLEEDVTKQEALNEEKGNFFINKRAIVNKKKVEFKVKIRPSKIKEK